MITITRLTRDWADRRGLRCHFTPETGSTNDDAKRVGLDDDTHECLYLTAHQTAGRGRGTNRWLDTGTGDALLSTWSLAAPAAPQAITAPRIGLALYAAARRAWPSLAPGLKAPNDLYLGGFKIAGLLIETLSDGARFRLLVGLGLNVAGHPRPLETAAHLDHALGRGTDPAEWFAFLDEWRAQLRAALNDVTRPHLSPAARVDLRHALNANLARAYTVTEVTGEGDLVHAHGRVPWSTL